MKVIITLRNICLDHLAQYLVRIKKNKAIGIIKTITVAILIFYLVFDVENGKIFNCC